MNRTLRLSHWNKGHVVSWFHVGELELPASPHATPQKGPPTVLTWAEGALAHNTFTEDKPGVKG